MLFKLISTCSSSIIHYIINF